MTAIDLGGVTIPSQQTLSPAGHDYIAFRPACSQVKPVQQENGRAAWTVTMGDNQMVILDIYDLMPEEKAHFWLDANGHCKINGVEVPMVYTSQVPERQVATPEVTPTMTTEPAAIASSSAEGGLPMVVTFGVGVPLALILGFLVWKLMNSSGSGSRAEKNRPLQTAQPRSRGGSKERAARLNDILGGSD